MSPRGGPGTATRLSVRRPVEATVIPRNRWICRLLTAHGMDLAVVRRNALMLAAAAVSSCLITRTEEVRVPTPLTPPRIQDVQGLTNPRLGVLMEIDEVLGTNGENVTTYPFSVPVDDDNVDDPVQFQFFVNADRDCVPRDGGANCEPDIPLRLAGGQVGIRRFVDRTIPLVVGCNHIELYVSSAFRLDGNFHTPVRDGDVDFATFWIFVRSANPAVTDGGVEDPIERCQYLVQP